MMGNFFDNLTLCLPPDSVLYHTGMPSAILVLPRWTTQWAIQMTRFQMHNHKMKIVLSIYRSFLLVFVSSLKTVYFPQADFNKMDQGNKRGPMSRFTSIN